MDLMFDSMPLIYDMIDDDMRVIAMRCNNGNNNNTNISNSNGNCNSSNNSANLNSFDFNQFYLTDDEQLALTNCSNFDDLLFFSPSIPSVNEFSSLQTNFDISFNSSCSSTFSTSTSSSGSSSPSSIPSSIYDDLNQYSITKYTTQEPSYLNNNSVQQQQQQNHQTTYQTINPLDLNCSHNDDNLSLSQQQQQQQQNYQVYTENNDHNLYHKPPSNVTTTIIRPALKTTNTTLYTQLNTKRSKPNNDQQIIHITTPSSSMNQQNNNNNNGNLLVLNSDGESTISNESDSNESIDFRSKSSSSSSSSSLLNSPIHVIQQQQKECNNSNNLITSLLNNTHPSTPTNINIIKLDKNHDNTKHIIHYKQLINNSTNNNNTKNLLTTTAAISAVTSPNRVDKVYPKPPYSYSCLIAMALRNSDSGTLPVSDIYEFIIENFPYYKTARDGWKNSIRHNLSLNKCFEKIENPANGSKKGCLWALNPDKCKKLEEECKRCRQRDIVNIRLSMSRPDDLNKIERGEQRIKKCHNNQRKLVDHTNNTLTTTTTTSNHHLFNNNNNNENNKFLIDWTNKTSPITTITTNKCNQFIKENDQYFTKLEKSNININLTPTISSSSLDNKTAIIGSSTTTTSNLNDKLMKNINKDSDSFIKIELDF